MSSQVALIEAVLRSLVKNERASASAAAREVIRNAQGAGDLVFERAALRSLQPPAGALYIESVVFLSLYIELVVFLGFLNRNGDGRLSLEELCAEFSTMSPVQVRGTGDAQKRKLARFSAYHGVRNICKLAGEA